MQAYTVCDSHGKRNNSIPSRRAGQRPCRPPQEKFSYSAWAVLPASRLSGSSWKLSRPK